MKHEKPINWVGSSYQDILNFPAEARKEAGYQLHKVQSGLEPDDWKPFGQVGTGIKEIRIWDNTGTYRVMYVAKFEEAIYVLHCFQKKTQATAKKDCDTIVARYRAITQKPK